MGQQALFTEKQKSRKDAQRFSCDVLDAVIDGLVMPVLVAKPPPEFYMARVSGQATGSS